YYLSIVVYRIFTFTILFDTLLVFFFFTDPAPTEIYTLSLHDALPIYPVADPEDPAVPDPEHPGKFLHPFGEDVEELARMLRIWRSEEHTSELQSRGHLVCRLLLEKKKKIKDELVCQNLLEQRMAKIGH